jgi:CubicO group peptidase (beta-lactamase class C family)
MKHLLLSICFSLTFLFGEAQTSSLKSSPPLTEATPKSVGMSAERLDRIGSMLEAAVADDVIPGATVLIARHGKIIYHKSFGSSDNPNDRAARTDDIYRIASQTKAITSTAIMMLWEEGKFGLDDPISKFIPEFKNPTILNSFRMTDSSYTTNPATREITIRHLLSHTSGLGYGVIDGDERFKAIYKKAGVTDLFTTKDISIGESVKKLAKLPLHHSPGDAFVYSEGLDVLGYLVEVVSGMSFSDFLQTRLFLPLGMNDTNFYQPEAKANRLVKIQTKTNDKWAYFTDTFYDVDYPIKGAKRFFSGGAGLSSTAKDYATFLQMYLNEGELNGKRFLSRTTIETMMQNQTKDYLGTEKHYGLAFGVVKADGVMKGGIGGEGTFDWGGYFNTQYFADPEEGIIGILMKQTQRIGGDYTGERFRSMVFSAVDN